MAQMGGFVPLDHLGAGNNEMADDNTTVRQAARWRYSGARLPRERITEDIVQENNYWRPQPRGTK
jgi:hypothetical protein